MESMHAKKFYNIIYLNGMSVNHVINYHIKFMYHKVLLYQKGKYFYSKWVFMFFEKQKISI